MRRQIRDQEATRSVRFPTKSVARPPSDQEAYAPDPPDDGSDADGYAPDAEVNTDDEGSTNYGVEVDDDSISEDEELDDEEKKKPPPNTQMLKKISPQPITSQTLQLPLPPPPHQSKQG